MNLADRIEHEAKYVARPSLYADMMQMADEARALADKLAAAEARIAELQRELEPLRKGTHWPAPWKMTKAMHDAYNSALKAGVSAGRFWSELRDVYLAEQRLACAALNAYDRARQPCPELRAAIRHVDSIARSSMGPTKEAYQMSHGLLVDLVLALHPPRVDLG